MRPIHKVISQIKAAVPEDWEYRTELFRELDDVLDSANYRAPELYSLNFELTAQALERWLGEPDTGWKKAVAAIFNDEDRDEDPQEQE